MILNMNIIALFQNNFTLIVPYRHKQIKGHSFILNNILFLSVSTVHEEAEQLKNRENLATFSYNTNNSLLKAI